jgi:hypothetical protein
MISLDFMLRINCFLYLHSEERLCESHKNRENVVRTSGPASAETSEEGNETLEAAAGTSTTAPAFRQALGH